MNPDYFERQAEHAAAMAREWTVRAERYRWLADRVLAVGADKEGSTA